MTAGFGRGLGVVRVEYKAAGHFMATRPMPITDAESYLEQLTDAIADFGDGSGLLRFDADSELPCWFRARDVITVDVVSTEDPGAGS